MVTNLKIHCIYWSVQKTLDMSLGRSLQHWDAYICRPKVAHLTYMMFFLKMINIILLYLLTPFIEKNKKKSLE